MPKQVACAYMFGSGLSIPIPDVDRTEHMLILGANPLVSNGSLFTAPDLPGRLRALRARGGKLVVVDPRRTETARHADEHHAIVPGTDAHLLLAIVHTLFDEGLARPGRLEQHTSGIDVVRGLAERFTPEVVAAVTGIEAGEIRRMARELAAAERGVVYGRVGTCTQEFGTLASWLVDVVNVLTGNLDRPGGAMFTKPATGGSNTSGTPGVGKGARFGRRHTRVRGLAEHFSEFPVAALAEEILEFMVSIDIYLNETSRHADVILPGESTLTRGHYDVAFTALSCRNIAHYSPPALEAEDGSIHEWEVLLRLAGIAAGQGPEADLRALDGFVARGVLERGLRNALSPAHGADLEAAWSEVADGEGPERLLDILLRTGPYGDGFGRDPEGLSLTKLIEHPHGIDLGPLQERIPEVLRTPSGTIELAPGDIVEDVDRLRASLERAHGGLVLVGRRQLRSNNSWMHNLPALSGGSNRCTVQIHPEDAARLKLEEGKPVRVSSSAGSIDIEVEVTDVMRPGVVSIPHGWGDGNGEARLHVAAGQPAANSNALSPADLIDALSGNAVLNGIPVTVAPV